MGWHAEDGSVVAEGCREHRLAFDNMRYREWNMH